MTTFDTLRTEFIVEVPGRGWFAGDYPPGFGGPLLVEPPDVGITDASQAKDIAYGLRNRYHKLGCPEIAATVRILKRTVTTTYSEWAPNNDLDLEST